MSRMWRASRGHSDSVQFRLFLVCGTSPPDPVLYKEQQRPCRYDDHARPDQCGQKWSYDPEAGSQQGTDEGNGQGASDQISLGLVIHGFACRRRRPNFANVDMTSRL